MHSPPTAFLLFTHTGAQTSTEMLLLLLLLLLPLLWAGALAGMVVYTLQIEKTVTVQEGLCVFVSCTGSYPKEDWTVSEPAYGFWFREGTDVHKGAPVATNKKDRQVQKRTQGRFFLLGDPGNSNCSLDIRDARMTDGGSYIFRVERGSLKYSFTDEKLTVRVTALTHTPDILIPGTLESGRPTNLTCSVPWACERGTPPLFSWTSATHPSLVPTTHNSSVLTLTPRPQDNGASLTCQVTLPGARVTTMRTVLLNVSYSPQNMTVTLFRGNGSAPTVLEDGSSLEVMEGEYLRLVCEVDSNPPARLSWTRRNWVQNSPEPWVLELPRVQVGEDRKVTCQAQNPQGSLYLSVNLLLPRKPAPLSEVTLGALVGAGVSTLLFLFCIIVFIVRSYRKKASGAIVDTGDTGVESAVATTRTISQGPLIEPGPGSPTDHPPSALAPPAMEETGEIQYATLKFQQTEPRNPQEQEEVPENEYSEIKISK